MKGQQKYYQLIPANLLEVIPVLNGLLCDIPGYSESNLKQLISTIAFHIRKDENSAPLKMTYLKKVVPQAGKYISALIDLGIIERLGSYRVGVTAYKYRFTEESEYKKIPAEDPKLIRRIQKLNIELKRRNSKKYAEQNKWIRQVNMLPGWEDAINNSYVSTDTGKINYAISAATRILNGDIYVTVDTTSNRIHTNLTNFPKVLLNHVTIAGSNLFSIDVKNSQPFISGQILLNPSKFARFAKGTELSLILQSLQVVNSEDVKRYVSLVKNGRIYEEMITQFSSRGMTFTRDQVKKQMLKILFDKNIHKGKHRKIFAETFPEVDRVFNILRGDSASPNRFKNYKRFAILLQTIEAYILNDRIVKTISEKYPETIVATKYDSIFTGILTNDIKKVEKILKAEYEQFFGTIPKLEKSPHKNKVKEEGNKEEKEGKGEGGEYYSNTVPEPLQLIEYYRIKGGRSLLKSEILEICYN
jgi:hypothetical protein